VTTSIRHGPDRFVADLESEGVTARLEGPAIIYTVVPATGALAGVDLETAVSVSELQSWPTSVPHWLHFREAITFSRTNIDTNDCLPGWLRHSRDVGQWDTSAPAVRAWLAHVRGVLSSAARRER
jgi:hypothetical protein